MLRMLTALVVGLVLPLCAAEMTREQADAAVQELFDQGQYSKALQVAETTLAATEKKSGSGHVETAEALLRVAKQCNSVIGKRSQAKPLLLRALKILESAQGQERLLADCLRHLALAADGDEACAEAEEYFNRELALRKKLDPNDFETKGVERMLASTSERKKLHEELSKAPPVSINGKAIPMPVEGIMRVEADPGKAAKELIQKGARQVQEMDGKAFLLQAEGRLVSVLGLEFLALQYKGHSFRPGDVIYQVNAKTEEAKTSFLKDMALTKNIVVTTPDGDRTLYTPGGNSYFWVATTREGYLCMNTQCANFLKLLQQEGLCPLCKQRLVHTTRTE